MLLGNYSVLHKLPLRFLGGSTTSPETTVRSNFNHSGANRNRFYVSETTEALNLYAVPTGYYPIYTWVIPQSAGQIGSGTTIQGAGTITPLSLAGGLAGSAGLTGAGGLSSANANALAVAIANLVGSGAISSAAGLNVAVLIAALSGSGAVSPPNLTAVIAAVAALTGSGTISNADGIALAIVQAIANLSGSGTVSVGTLNAIGTLLSALVGSSSENFAGQLAAGTTANLTGSGTISSASANALALALAGLTGSGTATNATPSGVGVLAADLTLQGATLTTGNVGQAVWAAIAAANNISGSMGEKVNSAASAGDPWGTSLPGSYADGTAGSKLGNLSTAVSGSAAINAVASSFTLAVGIETGSYTNTYATDGTKHTIDGVGNVIDGYYEFQLGTDGVPVVATAHANLQSGNDTITVYAWNWGSVAWDIIGLLPGTGGQGLSNYSWSLFPIHAGSGSDAGNVRIRFAELTGGSNPRLDFDSLVVSYAVVNRTTQFVGTAQAGSGITITLPTTASALDDYYKPGLIVLTSGTGAGQSRRIDSYDGATRVATVATAWVTAPDSTSTFVITPWGSVRVSDIDAGPLAAIAGASAGDPWGTSLGGYADGTAGSIMAVIQKLLRNKTVTDPVSGLMTVYDDDGTTVLFTAPVFEDAAGAQTYRGQGADRKDRLA